jgi:hypothetical protein
VVASNATSTTNNWHQQAYIGGAAGLTGSMQDVTVTTKYGELPQWFQVNSGAIGVPSAVQEPGDLAFINGASSTTAPNDTDNGNLTGGTNNLNVVQAIHVKGNITNVAALRQAYGTCLIPIRLWSTVDKGTNFTDVTQDYLDTQSRLSDGTNGQTSSSANPSGSSTDPFYVDCTTGEFEFTVPTDVAADHKTNESLAYELSVERGGVLTTTNNNAGAQPEFVFQATPIAYDPTNQFNVPGANGNSQYSPNVTSDARKKTVNVTASSPSPISDGDNYPTISFTTNPAPITWISQPTCRVYASSDTTFGSPLTGASTVGTYVTHCAGGVSGRYEPTQTSGSLTVNKLSVTVTASSPSAITAGDNYPTITFTTNRSPITWTTEPTCAVYASNDTNYGSPLTGASTAGTKVTHCTGGTSARYTPSQANGALTVTPITPLPSLANATYLGGDRAQYSSTFNVLYLQTINGVLRYGWNQPSKFQLSRYTTSPEGARSTSSFTIYYSPDGVNYVPFPA